VSAEPPEVGWGDYRVRPRRRSRLEELGDGTLVVDAEGEYLVDLPPDAKELAWRTALDSLEPGRALLRFGNFIGESSLGGRRVLVQSTRLEHEQVEAMLDEVVSALHSLPFAFATPTQLQYSRDVLAGDDVDYQAYAFLAHALRGVGPHDLGGAFDRILARPHMRLVTTRSRVPLAVADRVDARTLMGIVQGASPLHPVLQESPLANSPVVHALGGKAPEVVLADRSRETTDTYENRFVVAVLEMSQRIVGRFIRAVQDRYPIYAERHLAEAAQHMATLDRWRRQPAIADVSAATRLTTGSTVLRGRPGYRQVTRFFVDLQARTRLDPKDEQRLLELRDAALIYEYWCYFQVVDAVATVLGRRPAPAPFRFGPFGSAVPQAHFAEFGRARVTFNLSFTKPQTYSVPLRPDITLRLNDGQLHLFDAKLKRDALPAAAAEDAIEEEEQRATYRRGDLYKMHTYRDALGARSVWILFPGRNVGLTHFEPSDAADGDSPTGVGALPLLPGSQEDRARLRTLIEAMLGLCP
jgi:predicted component of viral defense system (DUF524 family)